MVLGDSYMDAYQLPMSGIFTRRLEHELRDHDVEVINLGVGGYGLAQSYLSLVEKGRRYEPDMVLLAMSPLNDVRNSSAELQRIFVGEKDMTYVLRPYPSFNQAGEVEIAAPDATLTTMARRARHQRELESNERPWWTPSLSPFVFWPRKWRASSMSPQRFPKTRWWRIILCSGPRASNCQIWCSSAESSGDLIDICYLNSVFEFHSRDHLGQVREST